jgi:hypothetical protein
MKMGGSCTSIILEAFAPSPPLLGGCKILKRRTSLLKRRQRHEKATARSENTHKNSKDLTCLPHPLYFEREGKGLVRVFDDEGNYIQIVSYKQLIILLNHPHAE